MVLVPPQLHESVRKLKRAGEHLEVVKDAVETIKAASNGAIVKEFDSEHRRHVRRIGKPPIPDDGFVDLSVTTAECAHQLRSLLDHIVCQIAQLKNANCDPPLGFPIFEAKNPGLFARMTKPLDDTARGVINRLQPYERFPDAPTDDPLWKIGELDRLSKHHIVVLGLASTELDVPDELGASVYTGKLSDGDIVVSWPADSNAESNLEPEITFDITFDVGGDIAPGEPVANILEAGYDAVVNDAWPSLVSLFPGAPDGT
jgi:hypothetical protein